MRTKKTRLEVGGEQFIVGITHNVTKHKMVSLFIIPSYFFFCPTDLRAVGKAAAGRARAGGEGAHAAVTVRRVDLPRGAHTTARDHGRKSGAAELPPTRLPPPQHHPHQRPMC